MVYVQGRTLYDADSHIMELPDFLLRHADPALREDLKDLTPLWNQLFGAVPGNAQIASTGRREAADRGQLEALGDDLINGPKSYGALGAFDPAERVTALDILGFKSQLVFPTFCLQVVVDESRSIEGRYRAARAHHLAMAEFCAHDRRLQGVATLPLDDPKAALEEIDNIVRLGLKAALIPAQPAGGRSPGHPDLDPIWATLAEKGIPFVLHIGTQSHQISDAYMNNGRAPPGAGPGGGEVVRGKDALALHHAYEVFIGALVLDGVFDRHRGLRGGVIEVGAGWVPAMLKRLDWISHLWRRSTPEFAELTRPPSQQVIEHMIFTPLVQEDVGALIRETDARLYAFSSDYPHPEGGRHTVERFDQSIEACSDAEKKRFYEDNYLAVFPA